MSIPYSRLELILDAAKASTNNRQALSRIEEIQFYSGYAEPGYADPESGWIAIGDWNCITRYDESAENVNRFVTVDDTLPRIAKLLEKIGVELEWSDEWCSCEDCGKLIRTSPNSYSWRQSYWQDDCTILCHECVESDPSGYLASLEGNDRKCETIGIDLTQHDYVKLESGFQHGFHPGQDADPQVIAKSLRELGIERFIFTLDSTGQFDIEFSVWIHTDDMATLTTEKMQQWEQLPKDGPSVSGALQRALQDASQKMSQLSGEGVRVATCKPDGTADVKLISPQDFIEGKSLDQ